METSHGPNQAHVVKALMAMAAIYEKPLSQDAADMLVSDLAEYEPSKVLGALRICRLELNRFPTLAEIIKRTTIKPESSQTHDLVSEIFKAISWHGYTNPEAARKMIGEVGWKAVQFIGGWHRLCDTPHDNASTLRAQLRNAVESAVQEKTRCDVLGIPFTSEGASVYNIADGRPMKGLSFDDFTPGPA